MQIRLAQYRRFLRTCWHFIDAERKLFVVFVAISVVGALTEGIGISLFVPLIDSMSAKSSFSDIPLLGKVSELFAAVPASSRIPLVAAIMFAVVLARAARCNTLRSFSISICRSASSSGCGMFHSIVCSTWTLRW